MNSKGHIKDNKSIKTRSDYSENDSFVLDKGIFSNVFEKDIRRVYIYKKTERIAKAIHLISPAFTSSPALVTKIDAIAVALIDAAILPPPQARPALSGQLLALSSILSLARSSGLLSSMNTDLISREAHTLLSEIADYEEPRLFLDEAPTLAELFKASAHSTFEQVRQTHNSESTKRQDSAQRQNPPKGQVKDSSDTRPRNQRKEAILDVLEKKGVSYIKDISTVVRDISEKTIQRELVALIEEGSVLKSGDRRWTTYELIEKRNPK